ncbi:MAG: beta-ketoacyl-ACP synthase II [Fastidiosipilaceae bacterium]|mgnify:CR=1 FL=1|jgi:3-oxoacyl-[acyl-carrier-protein] synthase II|nr:beta-ketoacyl-ACP synthase II [Clostridiaceae bacterium]
MKQHSDNKNRVVITGMGLLTPIGNTVAETWESLLENRIGIGKISQFDTADFKAHLSGEVKNFDPTDFIDRKEARRMDRYCQMALAATDEAMHQSGLDISTCDKYRVGVIFGTGVGGIITFEQQVRDLAAKGTRSVSPIFIPKMISNIAPGQIAMRYQCTGDNYTVASACASGTHAIGEAFRKIKDGYLDACICGGSEACITPVAIAGFANMTALATTTDPTLASLPFDKKRNGFVLAEGCGMLVLESLEHALKRGADIYGEVVGYGATSDAYHITSPSPDGHGAAKAMSLAMEEAGITAAEVDYINAHGTGTPVNDPFETTAIKIALGDDRARAIPINSSKSMTGHLLGAAGAFETIVTALSIKHSVVHRTVGLTDPDPDCDLDYVASGNRQVDIRYALTNSLGFGGHNGTLCLAKYEG